MNPDQTDPKGAILSWSFAIFDTLEHNQGKRTKQKCLTDGKRGKFVYLECVLFWCSLKINMLFNLFHLG